MTTTPRDTANRLLDGLVAYLLDRLAPAQLDGLIEAELDFLLEKAAGYPLNAWVTPQQIHQTARKYAIEMDISGAIPELVGDMVEEFYQQAVDSERLIADVVDEDVIMALLDKVLEIPLSRQSMAWLGRNPVLLALLAGGAQMGIKTLLHQGMPAPLRDQIARRLPERWVNSLDVRMQEWLLRRTEQLLSDPWLYRDENLDELRELVLVGWQDFAQCPVADLRELLSSEDIQELFVIGFEYWRDLRHTDAFNNLLESGVQAFFDKYGDTGLVDLLDELGVTRAMMLDDARRFAPPIIEKLRNEGLLEAWLRRHLSGFFEAEGTLKLLEVNSE